ncbi:MAG: recombinase RecT [Gemmatimonadota bacterium]|nr:recombinase RecT [Gemmatimonadota bacterium]MDH3291591.1 recombinase RecT [Gemmatimonadota bacterium]MDH3366494.1 recombinase RecT [Gemmatimonadota bacterium]MDH3478883.1 recombinase RecT [Gemmatimonadota bacterium]MDH3570987.1 recombinase RecT [Gemmatimonadota bacterium]
MGKALATVTIDGKDFTAVQMLNKRAARLDEIIPGTAGITGAQLVRIAQFEVARNDDLGECSPNSVLNAVYDAARLGLMLGREAHLVPYKRRCQMIPDYRGFITLGYRSQLVLMLDAKTVFPEDEFDVQEGSTMAIHHKPDYSIDRSSPKEILYFYAIAWLRNAPVPVFHVMNRTEVDRIRASSAMKDGIPWRDWYDRMGLKSAIKYLADKRLPVTEIPGLADLVEIDNRAEAGKISRPIEGEDAEELEAKIDEETRIRQDELKLKLEEAKANQ